MSEFNISQHINFVDSLYPKKQQFILSPVGSWNYGCADKNSDVDTKAIFVPSLHDIVNNKCESSTHIFPNEEHCETVDIRNFMKSIQKGNPQSIEVLFSNYSFLGIEYFGEEIDTLIRNREKIARCFQSNTMRAFMGMAERNYQLCKSRRDEDHANKWLYQLVRINECMKKFLRYYSYEECIRTNKRDELLEIKNGKYDCDKLILIADSTISDCKVEYTASESLFKNSEDRYIQSLIEEVIQSVLRKFFSLG